MLTTIGEAIKTRLEGLSLFKVVEKGFSKRALQAPPSAVFFLVLDEMETDLPSSLRKLTWEVAILSSYLDPVKGQADMERMVDAVRDAFTDWEATPDGSLRASVPRIRYEGVEDTLLVYTARISLGVFPTNFGT